MSMVRYVNNRRLHHNQKQANSVNLPHWLAYNTCVICRQGCRSSSGLKRHMVVQTGDFRHADLIILIKDTMLIFHLYLMHMKSNFVLKNHLKVNGLQIENDTITNASGEGTVLICLRLSNHHCVSYIWIIINIIS